MVASPLVKVAVTFSELSAGEAFDATLQILARSPIGRILGVLMLVGFLAGILRLTPAADPRWSPWIWVYPIGFPIFIFIISYVGLLRRSKRGPFHFEFNDDGLGIRLQPSAAHIIPKSSFANTNDLTEVRALIREKLGTRARLH